MVQVMYGNTKAYMDELLKQNLDVYNSLVHKDRDNIGIYAGDEREGKTRLMNKNLKYFDPTYDLKRCCFNGDEFIERIRENKEQYKAIGWDEAQEFTSRSSISKFNKNMVKALSLIGSKNLYIGICIPSFFELDKYAAIHRSHYLIRVYSVKGERGRFQFWNKEKKKTLYLKGKKGYDYTTVKHNFIGRFTKDGYPFDDKEYRIRKNDAMEKGLEFSNQQESKWKNQRNIYMEYLYVECKLTYQKIADIVTKKEYPISKEVVGDILRARGVNPRK